MAVHPCRLQVTLTAHVLSGALHEQVCFCLVAIGAIVINESSKVARLRDSFIMFFSSMWCGSMLSKNSRRLYLQGSSSISILFLTWRISFLVCSLISMISLRSVP